MREPLLNTSPSPCDEVKTTTCYMCACRCGIKQFGTTNHAAHGNFCSVNMAVGGLYTLGGSFWEFGEPEWEHARIFMLWGVAEHHDSGPIKLGPGKFKARGAGVRSGYGAIADEWPGIRPGTDGLFAFALGQELLKADHIDLDSRYTNAHWLVIRNPGAGDDGLFALDDEGRPLCWVRSAMAPRLSRSEGGGGEGVAPATGHSSSTRTTPPQPSPAGAREGAEALADAIDISPAVVGEYVLADGRRVVAVFHLVAECYLDPQYAPDAVSERCGIPAETLVRIARELAEAAFEHPVTLPIAWTDAHGSGTRCWSAAPCRCTRWAASARTATASIAAARCTCCNCCSAQSTPRARSATSRRFRNRSRRRTPVARPDTPTARWMRRRDHR